MKDTKIGLCSIFGKKGQKNNNKLNKIKINRAPRPCRWYTMINPPLTKDIWQTTLTSWFILYIFLMDTMFYFPRAIPFIRAVNPESRLRINSWSEPDNRRTQNWDGMGATEIKIGHLLLKYRYREYGDRPVIPLSRGEDSAGFAQPLFKVRNMTEQGICRTACDVDKYPRRHSAASFNKNLYIQV